MRALGQFNRASVAALVATVLIAGTVAAADQVRRWRDAEGNLHFSVQGDGAPRPAAGDRASAASTRDLSDSEKFSIAASLRRRDLVRELQRASAAYEKVRLELAETEATQLTVYSPAAPRDPRDTQFALDAQRDAFLSARKFEHDRADKLLVLRRRVRGRLREIVGIWGEFDDLRAGVSTEHHGKLPTWWRDRLTCEGCITREAALAALEQPREERRRAREEKAADGSSGEDSAPEEGPVARERRPIPEEDE